MNIYYSQTRIYGVGVGMLMVRFPNRNETESYWTNKVVRLNLV